MRQRHVRSIRILLALIVSLGLLAACGNDDGDTGEEPSQPDVTTLLTDASARIAAIQSLRFTLEVAGTTMIDTAGTLQLLEARGTLARPDSVDVQFQVRVLGSQTVSVKMITVGGESWTTDLISGNWGPAPEEFGYDPARLFDTENGLGPVMGKVDQPELIGEESIDDRAAWHVRGSVTRDVIGPVTANTMKGDTVQLDLWIARDTNDLLQIQLHEPDGEGIEDPATWTMHLRNHDEPVSIERPV